MKFSHFLISFAALGGAASAYAKEASSVGDSHISAIGSEEPPRENLRGRQLSEEPLRGQLVEVDTSAKELDDTRRQLAKSKKTDKEAPPKARQLAKSSKDAKV